MHTALGHVQAGQGDRAAGATERRGEESDRDRVQRVHTLARLRVEQRVRTTVEEAHLARPRARRSRQPRLQRVQGRLRRGHEADAGGDRQAQGVAQQAQESGHTRGGAQAQAEHAVRRGAPTADAHRQRQRVESRATRGPDGSAASSLRLEWSQWKHE